MGDKSKLERIEVGYQVFVRDGGEEIGAVRGQAGSESVNQSPARNQRTRRSKRTAPQRHRDTENVRRTAPSCLYLAHHGIPL